MTITTAAIRPSQSPRSLLNKVPEVTFWFWVIKVLCTTVGESLADYINTTLGFGLNGTAVLFSVVLAVVIGVQFRTRQYVPAVYWLAVVLVSVTGTLYTDILTDEHHVSLAVSSIVFTVLLVVVFGIWYARERTLSIHSINTLPREAFYWLTVLVTFALGTATGDYTLESTGWAPGVSVLLPVTLIAIIAVGWRLGSSPVLAFWLAYILTRPLGANLGDYLGQHRSDGGLGLGLLGTSLIFLVAIASIVFYLTRTRVDVVEEGHEKAPRPTTPGRERLVFAGWIVAAVAATVVVSNAHSHNTLGGAALPEKPAVVASLAPGQTAKPFTAAELSGVTTASKAILAAAQGGDQKKALASAKDLETSWDDTATELQKKNPDRWTELDGKIDTVLKTVRAGKPDAAKETAAVNTLLTSTAAAK